MIAIGEYTISALNDLDYYEVTSSDSMVVIEDENFTPEAVTFTSKHRLGNGNLEAYSGRFKIETSKDGETWETKYTSSGNESTVEYELPSALEDKVPYLFRKSVGSDRAIEEIVGGSVVWNQLVQNGNFSDGANGWKIYDATKGSLSVSNGVATLTYTTAGEGGYAYGLQLRNSPLTSTTGHKYLALSKVKSDFTGQIRYEVGNNIVSAITLVSEQWVECPCICEKVSTGTVFIVKPVLANIVDGSTLQIKNVQLFDLTTMFGTQIADYIYSLEQSSAGSGIAKLRSWGFFTKDYYSYCLPTIKSVNGLVEKKYVGFNQLNPANYVNSGSVSNYNKSVGWTLATGNESSVSGSNPILIAPTVNWRGSILFSDYLINGQAYCLSYRITGSNSANIKRSAYFVDDNNVVVQHLSHASSVDQNIDYVYSATYIPTSNNLRMAVVFESSTPQTIEVYDLCLNISDTTKNGTYEPYEVNTYSLDSSLELRGIFKLDSDNNLYADGDIYPSDGNGKRKYGLVDLGDLTFSDNGANSSVQQFVTFGIPKANGEANFICQDFVVTMAGYVGTVAGRASTKAVVFCVPLGTSLADFSASVTGKKLLYELADPTDFTALPYHNPQELSEYGTEEFVTTGIIPVGHNTKYPANIKNIRCSLYKSNETPSATTLLDQITVPIVSGLQYQPFVQRTVFEWALSSSSTELDENTIWAEQKPKPTQAQPYLWERSRNDYSNGTHTYSDAHCDVTISGVISDVDQVKGQITNKIWQSDITTSINSYDGTTVSNIRDRVSTTEQNLTGITTRVGSVESTTSGLGTRMTAAESSISQNADNIELKVSKDGVISSINQSPESITISADKVNIAGSTAFTSLNSQVTAIQNETNQKSELIRGTQTAATYSWTGTSTTISQLTDGMEIRYWLPFSVGGGTVSGSYSYYDGSQTTTGTNTGVGLTLTLKDGTMTEEIPVYYGSMTRLTSHYGYGNIIRMVYRENVRVNNGNSTYYTVAKGFWCDANYNSNSSYTQYSYGVTSGANNSVYKYSLLMRDSANTWVSIATSDGTGTSKSAYTGGLYYDKVLYHDSGTNYASNKTTGAVYDSIAFDLRYSTNCGTTLTNRKPVYLVGTINNTDKRFYLDTTQWWTQTVPTSADGKTYIYIGEAYSSYQVWLATENKAYQYYNGRFITLEEIKDLEAMTWINSTGQKAADIIANWATDATSATTTINGGLIQTHTIQASHLATNAIMSNNYQASQNANSPYSVTGSFLDLDNGNFYTPNFGLDNVNGNAYFNGEITATSGQIGDDTSNHWQIGTVVDFNGNQSAAIESNGTSYIQSGDWMISNNRIDTRHYDNQRKYTYLYEDGVYWDFGLHTPSLTSSNDYENNFIYIRNHESTIPTLEGAWNYVFRVDRNGMIYINGLSLDEKYASIDGVSSAYLPTTGGSVTGNLSVGGNLSVTGTITGLKNLSINGKTYNGSSAVTVGTIGAAYGGTGQTSLINSANALINALSTGSDTPKDNDYYISQYVNGGTSTTTYHRRPMSKLWDYIKGKINADTNLYTDKFVPKTGGEFTGAVTISDALIADEITSGNLIVNGVGRFTNGIYGDLTGNASTATVAAKVADSGNGQATTFAYSKSSLSTTAYFAAWDGYELRAINPSNTLATIGAVNKTGDTMTGHLTVPTLKVDSIVNDGYAHRIDFGKPSFNHMDFYEYGGVFNFYWNTSTTSTENATLLGKITTNGWEGNVVGNVTGNATTATKATQDGSGNVITSTYVKKSGDTMTGVLTLKGNLYTDGYTGGLNANNSNIYGVNGIYFADATDNLGEYINFYRDSTHVDSLYASSGKLYFSPNRELTKTGSIYKVLIEGDTIPESSLIWGNKAFTADYSMGDVFLNDYLRANRFAGVKASAITIEYSSDGGSTWNDYQTNDLSKRSLFTTSSSYHIGGSNTGTVTADSQLRITLDCYEGNIYTVLRKFMIYISTNYSQNCKLAITASLGSSPDDYSLTICENQPIGGWSGWNVIPCSFTTYCNTPSSQYRRIRFVFTNSGLSDTSKKGGLQICRIYGYGGVGWATPSNLALTGHVYTYDGNLNANFPASVTAAQFNGGLNGNATSATTASKLASNISITIGNQTVSTINGGSSATYSLTDISKDISDSSNPDRGWMTKELYTTITNMAQNFSGGTITVSNVTASNGLTYNYDSTTGITAITGAYPIPTSRGSSGQVLIANSSGVGAWSNQNDLNIYQLKTVGDNRSVDTTPNDYKDKIIFQGLKSNSYIGSPMAVGYSYLVGLRGWADSSGGKAHELAFNDDGIFARMGSTTTWESWRKLIDSSNYTDYTVTKTGTGASGTWGINITGNAATASSATSATTATTANSATKATQDGDGNTISSTYLKLSGGTVTGITQFNKTIRDASGQHYFGGAANRSQWYKITLAHNGVTPPSSNQWYMCSMTLHVAGDYNYYPRGTIELSYYIFWNGTKYLTDKVFATGYGPNINKAKVYYNLTNPFEIYVDTSGAYTTLWVDYVSYRDSAQSHNTKETKVETASAITVADYLQVPMSSIYTYDGSSLFVDSAHLLPSVTNTDNLGSSTYKWANVYATTFNGDLSGNATSANTATKLSSTPNNTTTFLRGDNTWSSVLTGSLTIAKAGECGVEVTNSQAINPNQVAFIVGTSGNGGIYSRKHSKWIVYSDASGNVVLNGNANTATSATKATQDGSGNTITSYYVTLSTNQTISGTKTFSAMPVASAGLCVGNSGTAGGLSLWNDKDIKHYGLALRTTADSGKHGYVQGDYATYNYMYAASASALPTRGWIFKDSVNDKGVASISGAGNAVFNGSITVGGNVTNTSGCRQEFNEDLQCLEFIFN